MSEIAFAGDSTLPGSATPLNEEDSQESLCPPGQDLEDPGTPLENEQNELSNNEDDDDDDDEEDDIKITIGDLKTSNVGLQGLPTKRSFTGTALGLQGKPQAQKLDIDASAQLNGSDIYDVNLCDLEEKPWRKPGADVTDYFNYGFTEDTWQTYCERQRKLRAEFGAQQANKILFSAVGGLGLVAPGCITNDNGKYHTKTVVNLVKNVPTPFLQDNVFVNQTQQQQPVFRKVITVPSPNSVLIQSGPAVPAPVTPITSSPPHSGSSAPTSVLPVATSNGDSFSASQSQSHAQFQPNQQPIQTTASSAASSVPGTEPTRFPNMSLPPPMFPPTNLPPPGFGPPGMHMPHHGMPPTSMPPPGVPPHMMPPPPGVPGGGPGMPGGYGFPPPMRGPMPMHNQPPPMGFPPLGERPPYSGPVNWGPPMQQPGHESGDRSPASYSDKSSGVEDTEDRERIERPRRRREVYVRERYSHVDRSPSKTTSSSRHRGDRESSRSHRQHRSHSRDRHQHSSDKERHRERDKDRDRRHAEDDEERRRKRKKKTREEDEVDMSRVKTESSCDDRRSKRRRDEEKQRQTDEPLAPGVESTEPNT